MQEFTRDPLAYFSLLKDMRGGELPDVSSTSQLLNAGPNGLLFSPSEYKSFSERSGGFAESHSILLAKNFGSNFGSLDNQPKSNRSDLWPLLLNHSYSLSSFSISCVSIIEND